MNKVALKTLRFFVSFINPGLLNALYKRLAIFSWFKKSVYHIVKQTIPEKVKLGNYDLYLNQNDAMVSGAVALNVYENFETEVFIQDLKPEMTVIDIGANIGYYTLLAASRAAKVIGFEPDSNNYELLMKNISENQCQNVTCYKLAVADKPGQITLFENPENFADRRIYSFKDAGAKVEVTAVTLDDFCRQENLSHVDLIKMDIQGAEGYALAGMQKILAQQNLRLFMEFFPAGLRDSGFDPAEILQSLRKNNFEIYHMDGISRKLELITDFNAYIIKFGPTDYANLYCKK